MHRGTLAIILILSGCDEGSTEIATDSRSIHGSVFEVERHALHQIREGRRTFRFDTLGSEAFWGGALRLHEGISRVSPAAALGLGLKVDVEALPRPLRHALLRGEVDL